MMAGYGSAIGGMTMGPPPTSMGMGHLDMRPHMGNMGPPPNLRQQSSLPPAMPPAMPPQQHTPNMGDPRNQGDQSSNMDRQPQPAPQPNGPILTLKLILSREEVSYLFGFDGVLLNQLRQQTGATITLTEPNSDMVFGITGSLELIFKAFSLVCRKLWDFISNVGGPGSNQVPLVLRLAVPASQCGSIIGKQGAKVKEIRDITGSNIQVSQESLPDSTERCVEISGTGESCLQCTYHICCILQEAPIRGEVLPYIPKGGQPHISEWRPVFLCGDKAYIIDGTMARPAPPDLLRRELAKTPLGSMADNLAQNMTSNHNNPPADPSLGPPTPIPDHMNPLVLMQAISNAQRNGSAGQPITKEMRINSSLAGAVIGKGGSKVDEIRRMSGAQVNIPGESETTANNERIVTITGTEESILLAQFLIQSNLDMAAKDRSFHHRQDHHRQDRGGDFHPHHRDQNYSNGDFRGNNFAPPPNLPPPPMPFDNLPPGMLENLKNNPEAMNAANQITNMMQQQQQGGTRYDNRRGGGPVGGRQGGFRDFRGRGGRGRGGGGRGGRR